MARKKVRLNKYKPVYKRIQISVTVDDFDKLKQMCADWNVSHSEIIRQQIRSSHDYWSGIWNALAD